MVSKTEEPGRCGGGRGSDVLAGKPERSQLSQPAAFWQDLANTPLEAALALAAAGFHVLPCRPGGKEPATPGGFYAASRNPETIRRHWRQRDRNVAVRTGEGFGVWILDVDGEDGEASLRKLEAEHGPLPSTIEVTTPRPGRHLWFRDTGPVPNTTGKIGAGIDSRGNGGYALCPPSFFRGDSYAGQYHWSVDSGAAAAVAPQWLIDLLRRKPTISERAMGACALSPRPNGPAGAYGQAALAYEAADLGRAPKGERNHALNRIAFKLYQLVAGGELDEGSLIERLTAACHANGLVADDGLPSIRATLKSARAAGFRFPRQRGGV
jgi:hypothetical protein